MTREDIVSKALKCIDEVYPSSDATNKNYFPIDSFFDEAIRWVVDISPVHYLCERIDVTSNIVSPQLKDGVLSFIIEGVNDFRVVYVNFPSWSRPVFNAIKENNPRYIQQQNKVLRGNPSRPVVAHILGNTCLPKIECYTIKPQEKDEIEMFVAEYSEASLSEQLGDIAAWKLAEIVLMAMSDVQASSVCTAKVNEHLQQLSL